MLSWKCSFNHDVCVQYFFKKCSRPQKTAFERGKREVTGKSEQQHSLHDYIKPAQREKKKEKLKKCKRLTVSSANAGIKKKVDIR